MLPQCTSLTEIAQRMSDTLQLVVDSPNPQPTETAQQMSDTVKLSVGRVDDKLKRIGHSLTHSGEVERWGRRRQAEAYRTFVDSFR